MTFLEESPALWAFLTITFGLTVGYWVGLSDAKSVTGRTADPLRSYTRAELHGFTLGILSALLVIQRSPDSSIGSPASSVTGPRHLPDNPPTPPPVAGAAGETG